VAATGIGARVCDVVVTLLASIRLVAAKVMATASATTPKDRPSSGFK